MFSWWVLFSSVSFLWFSCPFHVSLLFPLLLAQSHQNGRFPSEWGREEQGIKHSFSPSCVTELMRVCLRQNCRAEVSNGEKQLWFIWFAAYCRKKGCCLFSFLRCSPSQSSTPILGGEVGFQVFDWRWTVSCSGN